MEILERLYREFEMMKAAAREEGDIDAVMDLSYVIDLIRRAMRGEIEEDIVIEEAKLWGIRVDKEY
jgi:hypothetical protein